MENVIQSFMGRIDSTQRKISENCDQLISLIQSHKSQLIEELNSFKIRILKEVETEKEEMERQFVITESFKKYCEKMINKGTACVYLTHLIIYTLELTSF